MNPASRREGDATHWRPHSTAGSGSGKVKVKVHTLDIAPLHSESPPQKRSDMARVLEGFHS